LERRDLFGGLRRAWKRCQRCSCDEGEESKVKWEFLSLETGGAKCHKYLQSSARQMRIASFGRCVDSLEL